MADIRLNRNQRGLVEAIVIGLIAVLVIIGVTFVVLRHHQKHFSGNATTLNSTLSQTQKDYLLATATKTWQFYQDDVDPSTNLPKNSVIPGDPSKNCNYTSGTEIAFYLNSIIAARDLNIISTDEALQKATALLNTLQKLETYQGFLLRWYDTSTAQSASHVGCSGSTTDSESSDTSSAAITGFVSTVDDAWYASSLVVARQAFPSLNTQFSKLLDAMNWSMLYSPSAGSMYIGYHVGQGPTSGTYNLLYGGTRIGLYMGIGTKTVPGSAWWTVPRVPKSGRQTPQGNTSTYTDPQNGQSYSVYEGHYTYNNINFVPTFAGSMFQALAPELLVPETSWGAKNMGINDVNTATAQSEFAAKDLGSPVWGFAPATTPNRVTGYAQYGAPALATKSGTIPDNAVTPYASFLAMTVIPSQAYSNINQLKSSYPELTSGKYGYYDAVSPQTNQVAMRYMDVSQGTILSSIDDVLTGKLQNYFGQDSVGQNLKPYLQLDNFGL